MRNVICILKYIYSLALLLYAVYITGDWNYCIQGVFELGFIFIVSSLVLQRNTIAANIINDILLLVFNTELLILCFSGQYLKMIMIGNIPSIESLSGQFTNYTIGIITLIVFTFLPIHRLDVSTINLYRSISVVLLADVLFVMIMGSSYSPFYSLKTLYDEKKYQDSMVSDAKGRPNITQKFYKEAVEDYADIKPFGDSSPNIVLIFAEGLSQNIIDDDRSIMPNLKSFENTSMYFDQYYNHTAATYRGIISQLYSGYQAEDSGGSNTLVSIQSILSDQGYRTAFINAEPKNADFSRYLKGLDFNDVITQRKTSGDNNSLSDKQAFKLLRSSMDKMDANDKPFFIAMYTFGTHNTFDSPDQVYGDGDNALLNKFYNFDYQFGNFFDQFKKSSLHNNTILVVTTDHCTYFSEDFRRSFPNYERAGAFLDQIPLTIYYKGVEARVVDVNGRNSLDLVPTILDVLDISAPNYFLGSSLFNSTVYGDSLETLFYAGYFQTSRDGIVADVDDQRAKTSKAILEDYLIAIQQKPEK